MIGKPLCIKCSSIMYEAGYPVEYKQSSGMCEAVCARCGRNKKVDAYLLSDTPDRSLVDKIPKWVEADKDGRLYVFPVKKGGIVYTLSEYGGSDIRSVSVNAINVSITGTYMDEDRHRHLEVFNISDFGKRALLSYDDALRIQNGENVEDLLTKEFYINDEQLSFFD